MESLRRVVLVACGSFNPITDQHLRLFEVARDALNKTGRYKVIAGIISPVNDGYSKKDLLPATHRCAMVQLALKSSRWISLDTWETEQNQWLETVNVLRYQKKKVESTATNSNSSMNSPNSAAKKRKIETNKRIESTDVVNSEINSIESDIEVKLLCGADVLESFAVPGLWKPEHMEEIVSKFGMVVCTRSGTNVEKFIYESDLLTQHKSNIILVTEWITNDISATKIRRALRRGESVKYLLQDPVIDYIKKYNLYGGSSSDNNKMTNCFTLSPTDQQPQQGQMHDRINSSSRHLISNTPAAVVNQKNQHRSTSATRIRNIRERDACNNILQQRQRQQQQTECCKAFLRSQSLDNESRCCQLIPYQSYHHHSHRLTQRRMHKEMNLDEEHKLKEFKREISSDSLTYQQRPFSSTIGGGGQMEIGGKGGKDEMIIVRSRNSKTKMESMREDSLDSLLSSETEKIFISKRNGGFLGGGRKASLDSTDSISSRQGSSSPPLAPPPHKKSLNCMVADIMGLVRRIKRIRFSQETHV